MIESLSFLNTILFFLSIVICSIIYWYMSMPNDVPKGPKGLPFIGTVIDRKRVHIQMTELSKQYGPIYSYYAFGKLVVVLNSYELIRDLIVKQGDKFSDRPQTDIAKKDLKGNHGLIFANGPLWKEQRRFALSTLRDFGFGKPIMENSVLEEVEMLIHAIREKEDTPLDIQFLFNKAVSNVITQLVFGRRYDYADEDVFYVLDAWNRKVAGTFVGSGLGIKLWMIPLIPGLTKRVEMAFNETKIGSQFTEKMVQEHKKEWEWSDPNDFVFAYLNKQKSLNGSKSSFSDQQLVQACNELFAAGTETTSTTLRWSILYCCIHPEIQEKVFQEIKQKVGLHTLTRLQDRNQLPYTEAVIFETQRCGCLVGITARQTSTDIFVNGYRIPSSTPVILNYWAVHSDPEIFPQPEIFNPNRFLDLSGKLKKDDRLMPFGAGKRICIGESLAKMELLLFFAALIQKFKFEIPKDDPKPSLEHLAGITMQPKPFRVTCTVRN